MISYAQNREDVILNRAFPDPAGFYIDVGAADPVEYSVTKWFSDRGWSGINIEPQSDYFAALEAARPRDVNLRVGVSDRPGTLTLYEAPSRPGWATLEEAVADQFRADGIEVVPHDIPVVTLAEVCERHAPAQIDFLKIDVEGHEAHVLRGADFGRFRPRVLVVEATEVGRPTPNHESWEPGVLAAGYHFALFDGLNRFYVREEDRALLPVLQTPANVFDQYVPYEGPLGEQLAAAHATVTYYVNAFECRSKEAEALAADLARVRAVSQAAVGVMRRTRQHLAALRDAELRRLTNSHL